MPPGTKTIGSSCIFDVSANVVQVLARFVRGANPTDTARIACLRCQEQITQLTSQVEAYGKDVAAVAAEVRILKKQGLTIKDAKMRHLLGKSARARNLLQQTLKKRDALEATMDSINTTQINQSIFNTMQHTTKALRSMGVDVDNCDSVMVDIEGHMSDIQNIQNALGQQMEMPDDDDLENELLGILDEEMPSTPDLTNKMDKAQATTSSSVLVHPSNKAGKDASEQPPEPHTTAELETTKEELNASRKLSPVLEGDEVDENEAEQREDGKRLCEASPA